MYQDGFLADEVVTARSAVYIPANFDTVELGSPNTNPTNIFNRFGEAHIDEMYVILYIKHSDMQYGKNLYPSYSPN